MSKIPLMTELPAMVLCLKYGTPDDRITSTGTGLMSKIHLMTELPVLVLCLKYI